MKEFVDVLSNFGFPVALSCYLLWRFEKKIEAMEKSNTSLTTILQTVVQSVNGLPNELRESIKDAVNEVLINKRK